MDDRSAKRSSSELEKGARNRRHLSELARALGDALTYGDTFRWVLPTIVVVGFAVWASPGPTSNRSSELGAALLGGAVIAAAVLIAERRFAQEAENRGLRLQLGLQERMRGVDLRHKNLDDFHMPEKEAPLADLSGSSLIQSNFRACNFEGVLFNGAKMSRVRLSSARLAGASFFGADLTDGILRGAKCRGCNFGRLDIATRRPAGGAKLKRADLRDAELISAVFTGADLAGADLRGADLTGAILDGAEGLGRVEHDETTTWPAGFLPPAPNR